MNYQEGQNHSFFNVAGLTFPDCTGGYAYGMLQEILGERLRPIHGGTVLTF